MLETRARAGTAPTYPGWVVACVLAETLGMTAAAAAATAGQALGTAAALSLVVAGGLVEGLALGWFQSRVLKASASRLRRNRYVAATVLVAGLGWATASTPAALSTGADDQQPGMLVVALAAAALGLVAGIAIGAAQAIALRGAVSHPRRWVSANAAAWPPAMVAIFVGATIPSSGWSAWAVVLLGAATGAVAGGVLGVVSGWFLPSLDGASGFDRVVLALLASHRRPGLQRALIGLEVRGRVTGRWHRLPVQYAVAPGGLAVVPGDAGRKRWWRNVDPTPTPVLVLREGVWAPASARLLSPEDPEYRTVGAAYQERWPRSVMPTDQPLVLVTLGGAGSLR